MPPLTILISRNVVASPIDAHPLISAVPHSAAFGCLAAILPPFTHAPSLDAEHASTVCLPLPFSAMSRRSKSLGRQQGKGTLPQLTSKERTLSKIKQNSLRDLTKNYGELPSTSALIANGRLPTAYMASSTLGPRSLFSRRNTTGYGRNENSEMLNDVRDQLLDAKRQIVELNQKNKVLNTQLNRVTRESERREAHLQSIMIGRFQPAELNDTHLAVTLTNLEKQRFENKHIINAQAKRIRELEKGTNNDGNEESSSGDDYPEGYELDEERTSSNSRASRSSMKKIPGEWIEKHKKKLELAKAHVEQNRELKSKLKDLSAQLAEAKKKLKTNENVAKPPGRVTTADVNRIMNRIQENGLLKQQVDAVSKNLQEKLDKKSIEYMELQKLYDDLKIGIEQEKLEIKEQLEDIKREQTLLEDERNKMQDEHNLRELQQEQLSGEMFDMEGERRRMTVERDDWTKLRLAYEKQQIVMETEIRHLEEVSENLRKDNSVLRKRIADLLQVTIEDPVVSQQVLEKEKSVDSTSFRPRNVPRLEMRDMSVEVPSPEIPSVNSHTSQLPPSPSDLWDPRINFLATGIVAHIIRQDALAVIAENEANKRRNNDLS